MNCTAGFYSATGDQECAVDTTNLNRGNLNANPALWVHCTTKIQNCPLCEKGTFARQGNWNVPAVQRVCSSRTKGSYSVSRVTTVCDLCDPCPAGQHLETVASVTPDAWYEHLWGKASCVECKSGTFCPDMGCGSYPVWLLDSTRGIL